MKGTMGELCIVGLDGEVCNHGGKPWPLPKKSYPVQPLSISVYYYLAPYLSKHTK